MDSLSMRSCWGISNWDKCLWVREFVSLWVCDFVESWGAYAPKNYRRSSATNKGKALQGWYRRGKSEGGYISKDIERPDKQHLSKSKEPKKITSSIKYLKNDRSGTPRRES